MGGRRRVAAVAGLLALLLLTGTASAETTAQDPPDQLDPPAEGEGEYLEDPSDPPPPEYSTYAHPSPSITLTSGRTWDRPDAEDFKTGDRYASSRRAAREGWSDRARTLVLTSGRSYATSVAASALAGTVNGPLLLTKPRRLSDGARGEIRRLDPRRVLVVGRIARSVRDRVRRMGPAVRHITGDNASQTAMNVARHAVAYGAHRSTVIVTSNSRWRGSLGVAALASGKQWPVLLANRSSGRRALALRVRELKADRVFVIGPRSAINDGVISGLPNVRRIARPTAVATVAATARRGRSMGLNRRPYLVGAGHWADAVVWGAMAGRRRSGVVLATNGPQLPGPVTDWLSDVEPDRLALVNGEVQLPELVECQARRGLVRSWYCAEQTLRRQGYHMPQVDGATDRFSIFAIFAFEKVAGRSPNGSFGDAEWARMVTNPRHKVRRPDLPSTHVEIDIGKQLILLVKNGKVRHHLHTSTGKASTPTVRGTFTVYEKRPYMQTNHMYKSIFFYGGYAIHGYTSIPTYPASHGCARTYNGNQDFIYPKVFIGERVATY